MIKLSCPYCEQVKNVKIINKTETYKRGGIEFSYKTKHCLCCTCNEIFDTAKQMDYNLLSMRKSYKKKGKYLLKLRIKPKRLKTSEAGCVYWMIKPKGNSDVEIYIRKVRQTFKVFTLTQAYNTCYQKCGSSPLYSFCGYYKSKKEALDRVAELYSIYNEE